MVYQKGSVERNVQILILRLDGNPSRWTELRDSVVPSKMTRRQFEGALKDARNKGLLKQVDDLYCRPGQEPLVEERKAIGSIGSLEKMALIREAFHEIYLLRLTDDRNGKFKLAKRVADRVEPLLTSMKEKDPSFPYLPELHQCLQNYPHGNDHYGPRDDRWVSYCASMIEYCDRGRVFETRKR